MAKKAKRPTKAKPKSKKKAKAPVVIVNELAGVLADLIAVAKARGERDTPVVINAEAALARVKK